MWCEGAAHDAQGPYPQPRRCDLRVSGPRHRRAALTAALTALTHAVNGAATVGHRTQTTALGLAVGAAGSSQDRKKAAGWEGRPGVIAILVLLIIRLVSLSWAR